MKRQENFLTSTFGVALGALVCCALWGSAFPCVKLGYELFAIPQEAVATQILFAGCRFVLAGILTILMACGLNRKLVLPKRTSWGMVLKLCAFQTVIQYLFFYVGLAHASGVKSSIIVGSNVFLTILISCFVFHQEKLTRKKLIGCLLGFAGVVLVNWSPDGMLGGMRWNGEGFVFLCVISAAVSSALVKQYSQREDPMALSGYQFLIGGVVMVVCGLVAGGRLPVVQPAGLVMLVYLGFVSAAAYTLWAVLLKYNPVSRVSIFGFMNPVFGVMLSAVLLGEGASDLGWRAVCALMLICIGILVVNVREKKRMAYA